MIVLFPLIGFWYWVCWVAFACWLFAAVHHDRYIQASLDIGLLVVLLSITGNIHLAATWQWVLHNPLAILGSVAGYLAIGVGWSLVKWRLLLRRFKRLLAEHRKEQHWVEGGARIELSYALKSEGLRLVGDQARLDVDHFKGKIIGWMAYWWASAIVWLLGDALAELFETLYLSVRNFYQKMADSALND